MRLRQDRAIEPTRPHGASLVRRLAITVVGALVASLAGVLVGVPAASATPWLTFVRNIQTRPFVGTSTSMGDNEGLAYIATNDTLWAVDDSPGRLYAVNRTSGALGQVISNAQFQGATRFGGTGEAAGPNRVKDMEAVAYDVANDHLYVFSGTCCTAAELPTVFRLTRTNTSSPFTIESWQALNAPYNDNSGASFRNGELWVAMGKTIVKYDYVTNTTTTPFTLTGAPSSIYSVGFNPSGSEMWVTGSGAKLIKYDWATKTPVTGFNFSMYSFGVNDVRAVEQIGTELYLSDGYDFYPAGDTNAFGIRVFSLVDTTVTPPVAAFTATPTSGTAPLTVAFKDTSTNFPTSWSWNFGDGSVSTAHNPSKTYSTPGIYNATMTATNPGGSSTSASVAINVGNVPVASFTKTVTTGAVPLTVGFTDTSTNSPTAWSWNFGDGSPAVTTQNASHVFQDPGVYNVTLTATNASGSSTSAAQQVTVSSTGGVTTTTFAATEDASVDQVVTTPKPTATTLYNVVSATAAKRSYLKFNLTQISGAVTNAKLRLWVTDATDNGAAWYKIADNSWSQTTLTYANAPAVTGALAGDPGVVAVSAWLEIDVTSVVTGNGIVSFANLPQSTNQERYSSREGVNPPQLVVTYGSAAGSVPTASFTKSASTGVAPLSVTFADTSTNAPTSWSWNFGDGTPASTVQNPAHSFAVAGVYNVMLTATNAAGSNTSLSQAVNVTAPPAAPVASFTKSASSGVAPLSVTFTDTSTNSPTVWSWDFGDGSPVSTVQSPVHSFAAAGVYTVTLTATNAAGPNTSAGQTVTVTSGGGGAVTTTFTAAEDAYVDLAAPSTPKPATTTLYNVQSTNTQRSYIKFNVANLAGTVTAATLRIWVTDGTDNGAAWYKITDNSWSQTTLTWANAPAVNGSLVGDPAAILVGTWLEIPVTAFISGNGTVSFANLPVSANAEKYSSKEGVNPPQLVITTN